MVRCLLTNDFDVMIGPRVKMPVELSTETDWAFLNAALLNIAT